MALAMNCLKPGKLVLQFGKRALPVNSFKPAAI